MFATILEFLFLGWFFWPLSIVTLLIAYAIVKDADEFPSGCLGLVACLLAWSAYRYPEFREMLLSVKGSALLLGLYLAAGGFVSLWKWVTVLMDFKRDAPEKLKRISDKQGAKDRAGELGNSLYGGRYSSFNTKVKVVNDSFYPDYTQFPIATWWTYWPLFLFEVVLDPILRAIRRLVDFFKDIYEFVAKKFAVK